jgi:hypothetical protein
MNNNFFLKSMLILPIIAALSTTEAADSPSSWVMQIFSELKTVRLKLRTSMKKLHNQKASPITPAQKIVGFGGLTSVAVLLGYFALHNNSLVTTADQVKKTLEFPNQPPRRQFCEDIPEEDLTSMLQNYPCISEDDIEQIRILQRKKSKLLEDKNIIVGALADSASLEREDLEALQGGLKAADEQLQENQVCLKQLQRSLFWKICKTSKRK